MKDTLCVLEDSSQSQWGGGQKVSFLAMSVLRESYRIFLIDSIRSLLVSRARSLGDIQSSTAMVERHGSRVVFNIKLFLATLRQLSNIKPDIVYATTRKHSIFAILALLFNRKSRLFVHFHLTSEPYSIKFFTDLLAFLFCHRAIFASKFLLDEFSTSLPPSFSKRVQEKSVVFPYPLFEYSPEALRALPELPSNPPHIVYVGKIADNKGVFLLLEALKILKSRFLFQVTFAGDGPDREELRRCVQDSGLQECIELAGHVEINSNFWAKASIAVVPSFDHVETIGLVAYEAAIHGVPLICAKKGNLQALIDQGFAESLDTPDPIRLAVLLEREIDDIRSGRKRRSIKSELITSRAWFVQETMKCFI